MNKCKYKDIGSQYRPKSKGCNNEKINNKEVCEEHDMLCKSCKTNPAIIECPLALQFVCGKPLCIECAKEFENNCNSCTTIS